MPTFKYEATLPTGASVFGILDAASAEALEVELKTRKLTVLQISELALNPQFGTAPRRLPRLDQLRIGDRLREAVLTDMPTHQAIRAIAEEPVEHPLLMAMPWLCGVSVFCGLILASTAMIVPEIRLPCLIAAALLPVASVIFWTLGTTTLVVRPRNVLLQLAVEMEQGQRPDLQAFGLMSRELKAISESAALDTRSKAVSLAEIVPTISAMQLRSHQMAASAVAPFLVSFLLLFGAHILFLFVIPQFRSTLAELGMPLPWMTTAVFAFSSVVEFFGLIGLVASSVLMLTTLAALYMSLVSPSISVRISSVPLIGLSLRWLIQARLARVLSVLLRNGASPVIALQVAGQASGSGLIGTECDRISKTIQNDLPEKAASKALSGLPLSLLFRKTGVSADESSQLETARSFDFYAQALEQAASGNGGIFAVLVEFGVVIVTGVFLAFLIISLLYPLLYVTNSLA